MQLIDLNSKVKELATQIANLLITKIIKLLDENKKNATGELRKSIDYDIEFIANQVLVKIFAGKNYAIYVHEGTAPHFPPINKLSSWVVIKGKSKGLYKNIAIKNANDYSEVKKIAFAIAKKISKHGTKPFPFFKLAIEQADNEIKNIIKNFNFND